MKKIDLSELTDLDFENLTKDILAYKLGRDVRTFKSGRDRGIDAIVLGCEENWIGQAKFLIGSSDATMMSNLKRESKKVIELKPDRYILFVAKSLSEKQYREVLEMFSPFLKDEDLYDEIRIKDILEEKEAEFILNKWDKLWLPSPYFVEKFYEKFKKSKYEYEKREIVNESRIFVETKVYKQAEEVLKHKNIVLIHGDPGAGKTVLARRLALQYILQDYEFYYEHANDVKEIEGYLYDNRKKVIIVDDFLGQATFELRSISDNKLYNIINYAKKAENVKLILTTRTYIFNNARLIFEKFNMASERLDKLLIEVKKYTDSDKAKILYNHLHYNGLLWSAEYIELLQGRYYQTIITHKNFTPRNIAKICEIIQEDKTENVIETVKNLLQNPGEIWQYEYDKIQSSDYALCEKAILDFICFSKYDVEEEVLKKSIEELAKEAEWKGYEEELFYKAVEELSNAFITIGIDGKKQKKVYRLANPSMEDFLRKKAKRDCNKILQYIKVTEEIEWLHDLYYLFEDKEEIKEEIRIRLEILAENHKFKEYFDKVLTCHLLEEKLNPKRKKVITQIITEAFEQVQEDPTNVDFILHILENEGEEFYYTCALEVFKKMEMKKSKMNKILIYYLSSTWDWNTYLQACLKITKKQNSEYLLGIKEYLTEDLIEFVSLQAQELLEDQMDLVAKEYQEGRSIEQIIDGYLDYALDSIRNLYKAYGKKEVQEIIADIKGYRSVCLEEKMIQKWLEDQTEEISERPEEIDITYLFEQNTKNPSEILRHYIEKNITEYGLQQKLWNSKDKWFIDEFLKNTKGLKLITKFINDMKQVPDHMNELGDKLVPYLIGENQYKQYQKLIEEIALAMISANNLQEVYQNIKQDPLYQKPIQLLEEAEIIQKRDNEIWIENKFFLIYLAIQKWRYEPINFENLGKIAFKWFNGEAYNEILNSYSNFDLECFNLECVIPELKECVRYIRTKDKYSIAKSMIHKIEPIILLSIHDNEIETASWGIDTFRYIGIDLLENIGKMKFFSIIECLDKKYATRNGANYQIDFTKAIQDQETIEAFDKIGIWDYFKDVYEYTFTLYQTLLKNPKIDSYCFYQNQLLFEKYFDTDSRCIRDKKWEKEYGI